jgi:hypothetical protein
LQREFLDAVVPVLDRATTEYAITGSIASNYWGIPRFTHDLDVLVVIDAAQARQIIHAFPTPPFYGSVDAALDAVATRSMFNVIDPESAMKVDLWISKNDPFSRSMLDRRKRVLIHEGREAFMATPEDVLLHKLVWHTITPSERQLGDAAGIVQVRGSNLDLDYMRRWAALQGTSQLLEEVLQGKYLKTT